MKGRTGSCYARGGAAHKAAPSRKAAPAFPPSMPSDDDGDEPVDVKGKKSLMRLDRPGRKRGGAVGGEFSPLSSAAKTC